MDNSQPQQGAATGQDEDFEDDMDMERRDVKAEYSGDEKLDLRVVGDLDEE